MPKAKEAKAKYSTRGETRSKTYTPAQYLARERAAAVKSDYVEGRSVMMAGATRAHNVIVGNLITALSNALEGKPCEVYPSDMRVQVKRKEAYVYPDVVIVCGKPEFIDAREDTLTNPTVIVEVLSRSTYKYDQATKFALYKRLESLRAYIMVDSEQTLVWCIQREAGGAGWQVEILNKFKDAVRIEPLDATLTLRRIYSKVEFAEPEI